MRLKSITALLGVLYGIRACAAETDSAAIHSIFATLTDSHSPGFAVLVRKDGHTVFDRGYGVRKLNSDTKIDARTNFRLASFTKQFTAMAIMLLVHDGKLRYDTRLTDVFPQFPAYGREITIRHLLTHTSGLPDYESLMDEMEKPKGPAWSPAKQIQDEEVLGLLAQQSHGKFAPGASWAYSNSGYVLLGLIVAKTSGENYAEFLHDRIFMPLHMDNTLVYCNGKNVVANRAYGHDKNQQGFIAADQSATSATLGDGGLYSNLNDLAKWDQAFEDHTLLSAGEIAPALNPVKLSDGSAPKWPLEPDGDNLDPGQPVSYGFGWFLDAYQSHKRMWHSGSTQGFRTVIDRFPHDRLSIIIMSNRTDLNPTQLALRVAGVYLKE